jgi:uncharacterized protein (TIGR03437 family)
MLARFLTLTLVGILSAAYYPAAASDADALAISANIRAKHMPFGTILDPIFSSSTTSDQIVGYTRCGDSALWTGAYLAAESYRYKVTQSPDALANVKAALGGLKALTDVTGDNRLARCIVLASSPFAAGIANEEAHNTVHQAPPYIWLDNTSRDEVVGAFFGLGAAFDLVDDATVQSGVADLASRLLGFVSHHQWSPNDDIGNTFLVRPEELQMLLQVTRHVNPADTTSGPFIVPPVETGVTVDVQSNSSYFKFSLDYMAFYNLVRIQNNGGNQSAYKTVRDHTATHQNAFFNMVDRVLQGPNAARDAETGGLLAQWLQRPRRDAYVDVSSSVQVCGSDACQPVPVPIRPPSDFIWQVNPFQLSGGGVGAVEGAGIDYILPYWMARYYNVISTNAVQSSAAPSSAVAPASVASFFGSNLSTGTAQATEQPLPTSLAGSTLTVTDSAGTARPAGLIYASTSQINFVVPDGTAPGAATFAITNGSVTQTATASVSLTAPTLFSMNGMGTGVAAATAISAQVANPLLQGNVPVFQCNNSGCTSVPINLGVDTPIYVTFYGTGIRNRSNLTDVAVMINGVSVPVLYAGPTPNFTGLDQVNVGLLLSLRGSGESNVVLQVNGQSSNTVTINIQ